MNNYVSLTITKVGNTIEYIKKYIKIKVDIKQTTRQMGDEKSVLLNAGYKENKSASECLYDKTEDHYFRNSNVYLCV